MVSRQVPHSSTHPLQSNIDIFERLTFMFLSTFFKLDTVKRDVSLFSNLGL